ncbi:CU044_5270 family protein [Streptomyces sp. NPDC014894]|uniref:CU044_5270 family protein n=1 Tax=unclassified Streptomyces TaxID=2593676 RepID=UPI0036FA03EB
MDEMTRVRELRAHTPAPDHAVIAAGRRRLAEGIAAEGRDGARARPKAFRRLGGGLRGLGSDWRIAALGAAAAITAAALLATHIGAEPVREHSDAAATRVLGDANKVLMKAAETVAAQRTPAEPGDSQWIYIRQVRADPRERTDREPEGPPAQQDPESWIPYANPAAERDASDDDRSAREIYRLAESLSKDPAKAQAQAREFYPTGDGETGPRETEPEHSFRALWVMAESYPLSSSARSRLYRAMAVVPGVTVGERLVRDAAGRQAIAVTLAEATGSEAAGKGEPVSAPTRSEYLIDPHDYRYLGHRMVAASGRSADEPNEMNEPSHRIDEGDVLYSEARTDVAVVNAEGQTP